MSTRTNKTKLRRAGVELRHWRTAIGFTLSDAAMRVQVTPETWRSWEAGASQPTFTKALALEILTRSASTPESFGYDTKDMMVVADLRVRSQGAS